MQLRKYAIVEYEFAGPIDWENEDSISVNDTLWDKGKCCVEYINWFQYKILKLAWWVSESLGGK